MKTILLSVLFFLVCLGLTAQVPQGFNYQAVARDPATANPIAGKLIKVKLSILSDTTGFYASGSGTYVYEEEHVNIRTNSLGLFTVALGTGSKTGGSASTFSTIAWNPGPLYIGIKIAVETAYVYKNMGTAKLWTVPYAMVSGSAAKADGITSGSKLSVVSSDDATSLALFEVKRKDGQTVFAVYPDAVNVYVPPTAKGGKGGFAIGGFGTAKAPSQDYFRVTEDSVRIYIDNAPSAKGSKGGFAIGGFDKAKAGLVKNYYMNVSGTSAVDTVKGSPQILWFPNKNAFLAGNVHIGALDSVGIYSTALGYRSIAMGNFSQAFGYRAKAFGDYSTSIGKNSIAGVRVTGTSTASNAFAFGNGAKATGDNSYALGSGATASGYMAFAFGSVGLDDTGNPTTTPTTASMPYTFALGMGAQATQKGGLALGIGALASGFYSNSLGYYSTSSGYYSTALGYRSTASNYYAGAFGFYANAGGQGALALGYSSVASQNYAVAVGASATASNTYAASFGRAATASGGNSVAVGYGAVASNTDASSFGRSANAAGPTSVAIGYGANTTVAGTEASAFGKNASAQNATAMALGVSATASGITSTAIGFLALGSGQYSMAIGYNSKAQALNAYSFGTDANATAENGYAIGKGATASALTSMSVGYMSAASASYALAFGNSNISNGTNAVTLGNSNTAGISSNAVALGNNNVSSGSYSISLGNNNTSSSTYSTAIGTSTTSSNSYSTAIGYLAEATGSKSLSIGAKYVYNFTPRLIIPIIRLKGDNGKGGPIDEDPNAIPAGLDASGKGIIPIYSMSRNNIADGTYSLAVGNGNSSTNGGATFGVYNSASALYATAIGFQNYADAAYSFAAGYLNNTTGEFSSAFGRSTEAQAENTFVLGRYNVPWGTTNDWIETDPLFQIGNGSSTSATHDAFRVLKNGGTYIYASDATYGLYVNNTINSRTSYTYGIYSYVRSYMPSTYYYSGYFNGYPDYDATTNPYYQGVYADFRTGDAIDLAEYIYDTEGNTEAADVVAADVNKKESVVKSTKPYQTSVVGVITTKPHMVMGNELVIDKETGKQIPGVKATRLALSGRVPVKVCLENGPVLPGDYLTSSSTPGVAMKWSLLDVNSAKDFDDLKKILSENEKRRNAIIGKAVDSFSGSGTGKVVMLISLQ